MPSVLFVCTANMCRSPMAMALFQRRLDQAGIAADWRVESAGTWARDDDPAASGAQQAIAEQGLDLRAHRSRVVSADLLRSFDLILTMSKSHQEALQVEFKDIASRVHMLTAMAGIAYDVPDPIGGPLSGFRESAREIDALLERGFDKIVRLATEEEARRAGTTA
jgi:protein-tyrosine-phosphatase